MDGSVAFLDFSQDELGDPLSEEEKVGLWPMSCHSSSEAPLIGFSSYGRYRHTEYSNMFAFYTLFNPL